MAPNVSATAVLLLYLVTTCSAGGSAAAQPGTQIVIRPIAAERTLVRGASVPASASANTSHAWSTWGAWSACSRTCGGGVSVQQRTCLSGDTSRWVSGRKRRRLPVTGEERSRPFAVNPGSHNTLENDGDKRPENVTLKAPWTASHRKPGILSQETREVPGLRPNQDKENQTIRKDESEGRRRNLIEARDQRRRVKRVRNKRDSGAGCKGLDRRYHECNTAPCPGPAKEARAEQCASYDRRPFKGRFYTWVPYVDASSPCTLNCRPRGQQFYASLALVADGTPCTRPGFRAICVQGTCKVVGREGVLSTSSSRDPRCGRRLVSGLFTRPRLPLGYSHVATVPPGACRLNVSELLPSENYIALKLTNGSFIMNGEFAVSSPGTYEAAGAQFVYRRGAGVETIYSAGPTMHSLDIMILYQHPNPSIKYEYLTDTLPEEAAERPPEVVPATRHQHRHHGTEAHTKSLIPDQDEPQPTGARRFEWKILSFTQCSRACGGGVQMGKFRCVEGDGKDALRKEVSPANCAGAAPASRRRRCNVAPCAPRWRTTLWSACPACGPAVQTRSAGCVQDHTRGITKVSDSKCEPPMPSTSQPCNIPACDAERGQDARRQVHERTERLHAAARAPLSRPFLRADPPSDADNDVSSALGPEYFSAAGGWLYTDWSECVGWCVGGGVRSRGVRCADPAGCSPARAPATTQSCTPRAACESHAAHWFTGEWSACTAACGGRQVRGVVCLGGAGRRARDAACAAPRPPAERACGADCRPSWFLSDWSQCTGACGAGMQSRTVMCARGDAGSGAGDTREAECGGSRPPARRACAPPRCDVAAPLPPPPPPAPQHTTPLTDTQRIPRNQNHNPRTSISEDQPQSIEGCTDRLSSCALAVQARLCHYHYYTIYCCRSCNAKP